MLIAAEICPGLVKLEGLIKGNAGQICGDGSDPVCGDSTAIRNILWRIVIRQIPLGQMLEHRTMPFIGGGQIWCDAFGVKGHRFSRFTVNNQKLAICAAQQHALIWPFGAVHQRRRVGQLREVIQINFASFEQQMHQRQDKQPIRAGRDAHPFVRDCIIARADWVHTNHLRAAFFQTAQTHFDRIAVVIFGHTKEHEQFCPLPIGLSKFPKSAAHGVYATGGHIH